MWNIEGAVPPGWVSLHSCERATALKKGAQKAALLMRSAGELRLPHANTPKRQILACRVIVEALGTVLHVAVVHGQYPTVVFGAGDVFVVLWCVKRYSQTVPYAPSTARMSGGAPMTPSALKSYPKHPTGLLLNVNLPLSSTAAGSKFKACA